MGYAVKIKEGQNCKKIKNKNLSHAHFSTKTLQSFFKAAKNLPKIFFEMKIGIDLAFLGKKIEGVVFV